uniref:AMP-dependent synthetase/ligase domain-containing protein n=1 Tax=Globisporangium ultimum (strain ATCC 200006 / CBS 805.95 / DAOM BR144) TaxID=431595 RepID=K3WMF7_GLOUD
MADAPGSLRLQSLEQLIERNLPFPENLPLPRPSDVVDLPFSSGTTARPKGVELTARALLAVTIGYVHLNPPVKYRLGLLPFFHITATMEFHSCVYSGTAMVILPRFDPEVFLRVVQDYKMDGFIIAPPIALFLAQNPMVEKFDLSHVREIGCGGAPLGVEVESMAEKRTGATLLQGYGMTEMCGAITCSNIDTKRLGSAGKLMPNARMKVVSLSTNKELGPNEPGELLFHTPQLLRGYYNNPEANVAAFDEDGYLRTGDIGYIDDDGFVFIVDRIKELIKYKGHQVAPAELEDVLNNHPSVADACCVRGLDVKTGEEIPKAYVVLKQGAPKVTAEDIIAFVQTKVAPYKFVRELEFIETIPKSLSGKILRRVLQVKENDKIAAARKIQVQSRL